MSKIEIALCAFSTAGLATYGWYLWMLIFSPIALNDLQHDRAMTKHRRAAFYFAMIVAYFFTYALLSEGLDALLSWIPGDAIKAFDEDGNPIFWRKWVCGGIAFLLTIALSIIASGYAQFRAIEAEMAQNKRS